MKSHPHPTRRSGSLLRRLPSVPCREGSRRPRLPFAALSIAVLLFGLPALLSSGLSAQERSSPPHREFRKHESRYTGPGRDIPAPENLPSVKIGYFGPTDPGADAADLFVAAGLALEEVNREGGLDGVPFELVPRWSADPWGSGISRVAEMVYRDRVWAIIGSVDGSSTHLVEQVVAKARVPLLSPAAVDHTVNLANVPWMFSLLPGEHLQAPLLVEALRLSGRFILISETDHDSRVFAEELLRACSAAGLSPAFHLEIDSPASIEEIPRHLKDRKFEGAVVIARSLSSARVVETVRRSFRGPIFGTPSMGRRSFLQLLPREERLYFPYPTSIAEPSCFSRAFEARTGHPPDFAARQSYDAVHLLARAIRGAGLNRSLIADELRRLAPWRGLAGIVDWDPLGQNRRPALLVTLKNGRIVAGGPGRKTP